MSSSSLKTMSLRLSWMRLILLSCCLFLVFGVDVLAAAANDDDTTETCTMDDNDGNGSCQATTTTATTTTSSTKTNDDDDDDSVDATKTSRRLKDPNCKDEHDQCEVWASQGECTVNPKYMLWKCRLSCMVCSEVIYSKEDLLQGVDMGVAQKLAVDEGSSPDDDSVDPAEVAERILSAREYIMSDDILPQVKKICVNMHKLCSIWSVMGRCESNAKYMKAHCTAACQACLSKTKEWRCPIDPNAPQAWAAGDLDRMFTKLTSEPYLSEYDVQILSRPSNTIGTMDDGGGGKDGPWVITMENVLSEEEAETLIRLGEIEGYERSSDVGKVKGDGSFEKNFNDKRTSSNAWCQKACFQDEIAQRVVQRLSNITGIPELNSEHLQLLQYHEGQFYQAHHDYIFHDIRRQQGVRILTMYLYLNDVEAGGGTNFDKLNITVMPKRGRALLWPSVLNDDPNKEDPRTSHQALPVEAGIKYGANAWFHMRDFKTALKNRCS